MPWTQLPHRVRHRQRSKAKLWLNTAAAEQMTIERLGQRDPAWEILSWFTQFAIFCKSLVEHGVLLCP